MPLALAENGDESPKNRPIRHLRPEPFFRFAIGIGAALGGFIETKPDAKTEP
jgi:hypothetical protein